MVHRQSVLAVSPTHTANSARQSFPPVPTHSPQPARCTAHISNKISTLHGTTLPTHPPVLHLDIGRLLWRGQTGCTNFTAAAPRHPISRRPHGAPRCCCCCRAARVCMLQQPTTCAVVGPQHVDKCLEVALQASVMAVCWLSRRVILVMMACESAKKRCGRLAAGRC